MKVGLTNINPTFTYVGNALLKIMHYNSAFALYIRAHIGKNSDTAL